MDNFLSVRDCNYDGVFYPKYKRDIISLIEHFFCHLDIYPKDKETLNEIANNIKNEHIITFIVPHGAFRYSGYVASFVYYLVSLIDCNNFIILSSDHNGTSPGISTMNSGYWNTPLGSVPVNQDLAYALLGKSNSNFIQIDPFSLSIDHSIEIQLPFLQYVKDNNFNFLPLLQRKQDKLNSLKLAEVLGSVLSNYKKVVLIATSNLSHYLCNHECYRIDHELLSHVLSLNVDSYYRTIKENSIDICGSGCIATAMEFSKKMSNCNTALLKYSTSGDVDKNDLSVVGYSSILMF
ncbi:MAG: AmmeMemoRadiSam system protein B [Candidatus Nitrosocosmicus sp.]